MDTRVSLEQLKEIGLNSLGFELDEVTSHIGKATINLRSLTFLLKFRKQSASDGLRFKDEIPFRLRLKYQKPKNQDKNFQYFSIIFPLQSTEQPAKVPSCQ